MRYIDIHLVCSHIPATARTALESKHQETITGDDHCKQELIADGNVTWRQVKACLEDASCRKCWYTESKNPGCLNDVDHFRPKAKKLKKNGQIDYWYWFLAFDPENYRLSCQFSNRLNKNPETGLTGGKGDQFPLMGGDAHATTKSEVSTEQPVLLDPCCEDDCALIEFQPDGRPVVSARYRHHPDACFRVEQSKLLLNLDFPTFNEDREILYNRIRTLVERGDKYGKDNPALQDVKQDLLTLMKPDQAYSRAAECYIRCFRDRVWIEDLF